MTLTLAPSVFRWVLRWGGVALAGLMVACGGGQDSASAGNAEPTVRQAPADHERAPSSATPGNDTAESQKEGARLNSQELLAAERRAETADQKHAALSDPAYDLSSLAPGAIAAKGSFLSGAIAHKAAAVRIPVYRFYNSSTGAHFFTTSSAERDNVIANMSPPFRHEGVALHVASAFSPGLSPVHRFFNTRTGVHFYTISEAERAHVAANLPQFSYEGVAYHASQVTGQGLVPFYRFFVPSRGFHFYTASEAEKDSIIANLGGTHTYEGPAYHVLAVDWKAEKLPHTGIDRTCYVEGERTTTDCEFGGQARALNPQQDGHRWRINPMSYSQVLYRPGSELMGPIYHAINDCVRDNVTGLVWEGKTIGGLRNGSLTYTNVGNGAVNDASLHIQRVNESQLCGFTDWRLPTRQELLNLVDYNTFHGPLSNSTYFPNTPSNRHYWSAERSSEDPSLAWSVSFGDIYREGTSTATHHGGTSSATVEGVLNAVRLVRGSPPAGQRFTYSTVAYGGDAPFNVVNDAWTGLQWRRCEQGRVWNAKFKTCTGAASTLTSEQALIHARDQAGWRMPNIKELASLTDLQVGSGVRINPAAFPSAEPTTQCSTTPHIGRNFTGWYLGHSGNVFGSDRGAQSCVVRLIRAD